MSDLLYTFISSHPIIRRVFVVMTTSLTGVCENLAEKCKNEKMELERDLSEKTTKFERNQEADTKCVADLSKLRYVTSPKINSVNLLTSRRRQFGVCAR